MHDDQLGVARRGLEEYALLGASSGAITTQCLISGGWSQCEVYFTFCVKGGVGTSIENGAISRVCARHGVGMTEPRASWAVVILATAHFLCLGVF